MITVQKGSVDMKKSLVILLCLGLFVWGLSRIFDRGDKDLKNVGEVSVIRTIEGDSESCPLKGEKVNKRYLDDVTDFDIGSVSELASSAVSVEKPEVVDENNNIAVRYKGEFIDDEENDIHYSIYDSDFNLLYETETLGVVFDEGEEYYAVMDIKWGRIKNYVCLRYCFKITT